MTRLRYQCRYGFAPAFVRDGYVALYEVLELSGESVEVGKGEIAFATTVEALEHAFLLGKEAVQRLESK